MHGPYLSIYGMVGMYLTKGRSVIGLSCAAVFLYAAVSRRTTSSIARAEGPTTIAKGVAEAMSTTPPSQTKKMAIEKEVWIFCFGDSLTAGTSPPSRETFPYAPYLEGSLKARGIVPNAVVRHRGFPGWTSSQLLEASTSDHGLVSTIRGIQDPPVSIVVILAGTNDLGYRRSEADIASDVVKLHESVYNEGIPHTIGISVPSSNYQKHYEHAAKAAEKVNSLIKEFCESNPRASYHPFPFDYDGGTNWSPDGLHFSEAGYRVLGESLAPLIEEILTRADG